MQRRKGLVVGAAGAAVLLLAWVASADPAPLWREIHLDVPAPDFGPSAEPSQVTRDPVPEGGGADIGWLAYGTLVLVGVVAVAAVVWWLSRRDWSRPVRRRADVTPLPEIAPEELLDAADEFATLIAHGSARNAIVACWVRLEEAVQQAGLVRDPAETPTEMTTRVLQAYAVDAGSIEALAALYREARFSRHDMGEDHRRRAQHALGEIREQLRTAARPVATGGET